MSVVHRFADSLALSEEHAGETFWDEVYRKAFPTMIATHLIDKDGWAQRGGVDRVVILQSGKKLNIEQKVRKEVWKDILLEYYSNAENRTPGWIAKDALTDYLAYAFLPTRQCYLFDFAALRRVWFHHKDDWGQRAKSNLDGFRVVPARNVGYTTLSLAVPIAVLLREITSHTCIEWSAS